LATHAGVDVTRDIDRAILDLLADNTRRAIATLKVGAYDSSIAAEALTDLSAAYLARYKEAGDCIDLLRSAEASEHALTLVPGDRASLFNRAQALTLLGTRATAKRAWQALLTGQTRDGWSQEARVAVSALDRPTLDDEWSIALKTMQASEVSNATIETFTRRFPSRARGFAEEVLLPRWAGEVAAGDDGKAARSFALASAIGATLFRARGEALTDEAVRAAGDAVEGPGRAVLLRGLQSFGAGLVQFNDQNMPAAKALLERAADDLEASRNPLHYWARFYLALQEYYGNTSGGLQMLDKLLSAIPADRYPALEGRIYWITGTADKIQGRIQSSVHRYERAAASLRKSGGESAAAFVLVLLAESYSLIGEEALAWQSRRDAFAAIPITEGPRYNIAMWTEAATALARSGNARLAGPLLEEAVADANRWKQPFGLATAYIYRAGYWTAVGKRADALADLRNARAAIARMPPGSLRDYENRRVLIPEGLCAMEDSPAQAADLLQRALARQNATGNRFDDITYTTELARAQLAAGRLADGAATLERAVALFEDIRSTVEDPVSRMQAFRQAQPAFDKLITLRITSLPDDGEAFLLAERSRARVLLELADGRGDSANSPPFVSLGDAESALPVGTALVSYVVLDDCLVAWVVTNRQSRRVLLTATPRAVEENIDRFRLRMTRADSAETIREAAAPLYDALVRPLGLTPAEQSLIVIPDRWLAHLPFAALFDRQSGRYLIEQRTVTIAASATLLLRAAPRASSAGAEPRSVVFAVSRSGEYHGMSVSPLAYAENEARAVAAIYRRGVLMDGSAATRANFLSLSVSTDVIHFAGHAVVDLNAPRRSVLLFAGPSGDLEPLSLGDLLDAGVGKAALVVLSACRAQDSLADDREGLLGLAGAFAAGGVREVVASPLDVDDRLAPPVMAAFHRHYRQRRSARLAYRDTVVELLQSLDSELRSPAAWGGFTVIQGQIEHGGER
jgi:CHAT domain-containing protein